MTVTPSVRHLKACPMGGTSWLNLQKDFVSIVSTVYYFLHVLFLMKTNKNILKYFLFLFFFF